MSPLTAGAWVIVQDEVILTRTLMDTQRGAMVNWLITECGIVIRNTDADEEISKLFWQQAHAGGARGKVYLSFCTVTVNK